MTRLKMLTILLLTALMLVSACGKKGPVRPIGSPPVQQPCDTCGSNQ